MEKVLVVTSRCFGKANANGICARNLAEAFNAKGTQAFLLGIADSSEKGKLLLSEREHVVFHSNLMSDATPTFWTKVKNVLSFSIKPKIDLHLVRLFEQAITSIIEENGIQILIAIYFPIEAIVAVSNIKKKYPKHLCFSFELDSASDGILFASRFHSLFINAQKRFLKKQYRILDAVFVMQSHADHVKKLYGDVLRDKLVVTDLPVLTEKNIPESDSINETNFLYAGILDRVYRSPKVLLDLFSKNPDSSDWRMHFFSKGNCEDDLRKASEIDARIHCHGYVSSDELDRAIGEAEVLVSIGNASSNSVPSKIINYISYGKPIIHFCLQEDDVCCPYFAKYPLALVIPFGMDADEAVEKIKVFVQEKKGERIPFSLVKELFVDNLPEHSAELILKFGDR